jgi:cell division protein FtsX
VPLVCFIVGILFGILSRLTPLRKYIDDLWWGILLSYLIFAFAIASIFSIQIIWTEIARSGILQFLANIIPFTLMILMVWAISVIGVLCLLIIPHVGGFAIVARPKM